jgi:hypothetical protein
MPTKKFKPGVSGNPKGRPPEPAELRAIKNLTKAQLLEVLGMVTTMTLGQLEELANSKEATVLQSMVCGLAIQVMKKGDAHAFDVLMNRALGKVSDKVKHSGIPEGTAAQHVIMMLPVNGFEKKMKQVEGQ